MTIQTASNWARRHCRTAALHTAAGVAAATIFGLGGAMAQAQAGPSAPAQSSSAQTTAGTAAPGTKAATVASKELLKGPAITKYDNRYEVYGGLLYANGQAGQVLPKHYNMGGGEVMGTYWLTNRLGAAADFRIQAGTSPVAPIGSQFGFNRVTVRQTLFSGGVQVRGPKNRYAAIDFHALAGGTYGVFDTAVRGYPASTTYPGGSPVSACPAEQSASYPQIGNLGLYCNHTAPFAALGASVDFNYSPNIAIRLQPDLTLEHFGTETREFFAISMGVVYRFGHR